MTRSPKKIRFVHVTCPICGSYLHVLAPEEKTEVEPGELIVRGTCPYCDALLEVIHGDDLGEIGVIGTAGHQSAIRYTPK